MPLLSPLVDLMSGAGAVVLVLGLAFLVAVSGLAYPAVWSRHESRRQAALELMRLLLARRGDGGMGASSAGVTRHRKGSRSQDIILI
jgi:hypothetical protein